MQTAVLHNTHTPQRKHTALPSYQRASTSDSTGNKLNADDAPVRASKLRPRHDGVWQRIGCGESLQQHATRQQDDLMPKTLSTTARCYSPGKTCSQLLHFSPQARLLVWDNPPYAELLLACVELLVDPVSTLCSSCCPMMATKGPWSREAALIKRFLGENHWHHIANRYPCVGPRASTDVGGRK